MGAQVFTTVAAGPTADIAFTRAVEDACYRNGLGGYTGTIAEKEQFVMIALNEGETHYDLINARDPRIDDKWGPAGCIDMGNGDFLFFGWASS